MTKFMAVAASIIFTFTTALASLLGNVNIANASQRHFINDLYKECNGKNPSIFEAYIVYNGTTDGKQIVYDMLHSDKFYNQNLTEEQIINLYYNVFFDKDATDWDIEFWKERITVDDTTLLFYGMINSKSYEEKCSACGIDSDEYFIENVFTEGIYNNNPECGLDANGDYVFYATFGNSTYYHVVRGAAL